MDPAESEVRRCPACHEPTLVCLKAWRDSDRPRVLRECRCQACGRAVTLHDPAAIRTALWVGILLMPLIVPALIWYPLWFSRRRAWAQSPLVSGAPRPEIRYRIGPAPRQCGRCGKVTRLLSVTQHRHNGIPTGTTYKYRCDSCGNAFTLESVGGSMINFLAAALFDGAALGIFLGSKRLTNETWGIGLFSALLGLAITALLGSRLIAAIHNPRVH